MSASAARRPPEPPRLAGIIGGRIVNGHPVARHSYRLGVAPAPEGDVYIVHLMDEVPGVGITFEANSFEHAFERALEIGEDMADLAGHLAEGVVVSVEAHDRLADIGLDED